MVGVIESQTEVFTLYSLKTAVKIQGFVPEVDEEGKPLQSDSKFALSATAFVVAAGAIALRVGGRAALISAVGLDFLTENTELQGQMNQILDFAETVDPLLKGGLFCLAWTLVKVLCFDAGGIVLALSAGILFGGVLQGAIASAFAATVGSSVAFAMAKLDTPVRKKALEVVEDNPSLRGIEKVVAEDGLKAILTLRLAPVLPIPLGMYNYVYGVTNVPYFDFAGGIFLGSLKPYLLDSYLGYFGKSLVDGSAAAEGGIQDVLLLVALGFSVLIGVFASQLAGETWEAVIAEEEAEKKRKRLESGEVEEEKDKIVREVFGVGLPQWLTGFQLGLQEADTRIDDIVLQEFDAKVWNYTLSDGDNPIPRELNPAYSPSSPETTGAYKGFDFAGSICDGIVLTPILFGYFLQFSDPLFDENAFLEDLEEERPRASVTAPDVSAPLEATTSRDISKDALLNRLQTIRDGASARLEELNRRLDGI